MGSLKNLLRGVSEKQASSIGKAHQRTQTGTRTALLALLVLLGSASFGSANVDPKTHTPKIPKLIEQNPGAPFLIARDNYYSPRYLQVKAREGGILSVENKGANMHGLIIPAFGYQGVVQPGGVHKIVVPKKKVGLYDFYCPYHKGMRGTIEVLSGPA